MAIVMGLDQHRAQITAEWIDTDTGEIGRARISPALRGDVRRFFKRFAGQRLEVALEATTGWRFVVEELHAIGARGPSGRAGGDGGAARQQEARQDRPRRRAAPARAADDRAAARVVDPARAPARSARPGAPAPHAGRSARRVAAAHPGRPLSPRLPAAHGLLTGENRAWLEGLPLPASAREQVTVALTMIDALDAQSAPITRELRLYARRQPGCRALMQPLRHRRADRGHDPGRARRRAALLLLAPRRALRRAGHHRPPVRPAPRRRASLPPGTAGAALGAVRGRPGRPPARQPRPRLLRPGRRASRRQPRLPRAGPQAAQAQLPHPARARRRGPGSPPDEPWCAPCPQSLRCTAAGSPHAAAATTAWTASKDRAAAPHPAGTPHHPSRHRPAARRGRGPR